MQKRKFDELISFFNRKVSEMEIGTSYKMELLGMVTALGYAHEKETEERKTWRWIPVSERLPEEKGEYLVTYHPCYWDNVDEEIKVGIDTFRGKTTWAKKKYQRVIAWQPLQEPYREDGEADGQR